MPNKRLFLIGNPTQYLNAIELISFESGNDDSVIILSQFTEGIYEINKLFGVEHWKNEFKLDLKLMSNNPSSWRAWSKSIKFLQASFDSIRPDELVVGNLSDVIFYTFYLRNRNRIKKLTVLDDGTPTLNLLDKRVNYKFYNSYHLRDVKLILKIWFSLGLFLPVYKPPSSIRFFSIFNVNLDNRDVFVRNEYSWLKSKFSFKGNNDGYIYFIGSHVVDRNLVSEADFLTSIKIIKNIIENSGYELIYVYHRGESDKIKSKIKEITTTVDYNKPLEFVFLDTPSPSGFVGHFSSALFTLSRLYPVPVKAFLFPEKRILGSNLESKEDILKIQRALLDDDKIESSYIDFK